MPAPHPVEFRQRAVELARTGDKPIAQLAKIPTVGVHDGSERGGGPWVVG